MPRGSRWQKFWNPNNALIASHLSGNGLQKFGADVELITNREFPS